MTESDARVGESEAPHFVKVPTFKPCVVCGKPTCITLGGTRIHRSCASVVCTEEPESGSQIVRSETEWNRTPCEGKGHLTERTADGGYLCDECGGTVEVDALHRAVAHLRPLRFHERATGTTLFGRRVADAGDAS